MELYDHACASQTHIPQLVMRQIYTLDLEDIAGHNVGRTCLDDTYE